MKQPLSAPTPWSTGATQTPLAKEAKAAGFELTWTLLLLLAPCSFQQKAAKPRLGSVYAN